MTIETSAHLDWVSVTFPIELEQGYWLPASLHQFPLVVQPGRAANYAVILSNDIGVIVLTQGENRQGTHVQYKGEPLADCRAIGLTDRDLLMHVMEYQGKLSRLDVALNIHGGKTKAKDLAREWSKGHCSTLARGASRAHKLKTEEDTLYIGSRTSERLLRAYNKGAQMKMDENWLRLELECKKVMAQAVGETIAKSDNPRAVMNRAIKDFADFPRLSEIQDALADDDAKIPKPKRKIHSTYKWLMEIVAPALACYEYDHPEDDVAEAFNVLWRHHLDELRKHGPR